MVGWMGTLMVHTLVIHHSIVSDVPNVYTGLAPVDMSMIMPKTGLAVNIPHMVGGVNLKLVLPQTKMTMEGEHPASYELQTSAQQDMMLAMLVPLLLAMFTVPFTILRMLLLGWNCTLAKQELEGDLEEEEEGVPDIMQEQDMCSGGITYLLYITFVVFIIVLFIIFALN